MVAVGLVFVVVWFVFCFCFCVVFSVLVFPLLPACLSSFTDWCLVHRQQSREQKKTMTIRQFHDAPLYLPRLSTWKAKFSRAQRYGLHDVRSN